MEPRPYVAALIYQDGKYLAQYHHNKSYELWRLPGGKVEPGEMPIIAMARELKEELGVDTKSLIHVQTTGTHESDSGLWQGYIYLAIIKGEPVNMEPEKISKLEYLSCEEFIDNECPVASLIISVFEVTWKEKILHLLSGKQ